ncbi:MAG TPA: translation initiation factor IF-2 N-terminal domain-containing protein, partial [Tepidisphaeraceae bacterium]|nr:translation initiation factor IF-2 N-terminal domain-containing protein [Tepidisphaeraceae bacterium]
MAKGIRINDLAKELGVPSKAILEKCISESIDFDGKKPSGAISISMGLAETIKDWAAEGAFAQAESNVAVAEKPRKGATKKKRTAEEEAQAAADGEQGESGEATPDAAKPEPVQTEVHRAEVHKAEVAKPDSKSKSTSPEVRLDHPSADTVSDSSETSATPTIAAKVPVAPVTGVKSVTPTPASIPSMPIKPIDSPADPVMSDAGSQLGTQLGASQATAPLASADTARPATRPTVSLGNPNAPVGPNAGAHPGAHPGAHAGAHGPRSSVPPVNRPTISLDDRLKQERASTPAFVPKKAEVKGPALIREEKPDFTPTPRPKLRGPGGPIGPPSPGGTTPARPTGGRGVRATEDDDEGAKKKGAKGGGASGASRSLRRSPDGRRGEADEKLREFTEADIIERRDRLREATSYRAGMASHLRKSGQIPGGRMQTAAQRGGAIEIQEPITVKSLSSAVGVKVNDIIGKLMKSGVMATINQVLDFDT